MKKGMSLVLSTVLSISSSLVVTNFTKAEDTTALSQGTVTLSATGNTVSGDVYGGNTDYSSMDLTQLKSTLASLNKKLKTENDNLNKYKKDLSSYQKQINDDKNAMNKLKNGKYKISEQKNIQNKIDDYQKKINALNQKLNQQYTNISKENATINNINKQINAVNKAIKAAGVIPKYSLNGITYEITAYNPNNNHKYTVFDKSMTWADAEKYCESLGGHLATVDSPNENKLISQIISLGSKERYWLGANDLQTIKDFKWVTNEPFNYTNWQKGQPDNSKGRERYLMMYKGQGVSGQWNDAASDSANNAYGFVCEWGTDNN